MFAIFNKTTNKWVMDADSDKGGVYLHKSLFEANMALKRVIELSKLNPEHSNDMFEIRDIKNNYEFKSRP